MNKLASRASFDGECASEFETSVNRSSAEIRQFIGGSEERPVSSAWICGVKSPKHASIVSKPEYAPNREKCGVQICAGIKIARGQISRVISSRSRMSSPKIGLPSECRFPICSSRWESASAASKSGSRITLWTFLVFPSFL